MFVETSRDSDEQTGLILGGQLGAASATETSVPIEDCLASIKSPYDNGH
jgi:hypothetical protein